jgi:hypothetical protein
MQCAKNGKEKSLMDLKTELKLNDPCLHNVLFLFPTTLVRYVWIVALEKHLFRYFLNIKHWMGVFRNFGGFVNF